MEVCIIGGGICGIISTKISLEYNLIPFVLTKDPRPGGLWDSSPNRIGVWDSMTSNTSKYLFSFTDHLWSSEDPDFPTNNKVLEYFNSYIQKHNLLQYFAFNSEVISVSRESNEYKVLWSRNGEISEKIFKYVVIATGRCSKVFQPFKSRDKFQGEVLDGGLYRNPSVFTNKKLVCIGRSFTSNDIASEALETANQVTQICTRPYFVLKKYYRTVPTDFLYNSINLVESPGCVIQTLESNKALAKYLASIYGNPSTIYPGWHLDIEEFPGFIKYIQCNDNYLKSVVDGKIEMISGEVEDFYENGVVLTTGQRVEADIVLNAVGYVNNYEFLSDEIKEIIKYQPDNAFLSVIMYRGIFHPDLPNMCFVGNVLSGTPGRYELSAEVGIRSFFGTLILTPEEIQQGLIEEEYIRNNLKGAGNTYSFMGLLQEHFRILGIKIDYDFIRNELDYKNGPLLPQFFYLDKPGMKDLSRQVVNEIKAKFVNFQFN